VRAAPLCAPAADLARYKDLVAKEAAPRQQLDTQTALVRQLEATVMSDQAALENARLQLSYTRVTAPIAGQAGLKQADLGNNVTPGDANGLLSIAQTQPAAVVFAVPDARLARIRQQLADRQPLAVQAWDRERRQLLGEGSVASTDNAIDAATGTTRSSSSSVPPWAAGWPWRTSTSASVAAASRNGIDSTISSSTSGCAAV